MAFDFDKHEARLERAKQFATKKKYKHKFESSNRKKSFIKEQLTEKQQLFCDAYIISGGNVTEAKAAVGYAEGSPSCYKILQKPKAKAYIANAREELRQQMKYDYEWKYNRLGKIAEEAEDNREVIGSVHEMNLMAGDHAGEKRINFNIDTDKDIQRLLEVTSKIKYKVYDNNLNNKIENLEIENA
jgi:hypothetical protein